MQTYEDIDDLEVEDDLGFNWYCDECDHRWDGGGPTDPCPNCGTLAPDHDPRWSEGESIEDGEE